MNSRFLFATLFIATLLFSCTDNSNDPDQNDLDPNCSLESSMMLKVGNYWIYNTTEIDENGNAVAGTEGIDSSYVSGMQTVAGKQAFEMITHSRSLKEDSAKLDTTYYAVEGGRAYMLLAKSVENVAGYCKCLTHDWVLFADCSKKNWSIMDQTIQGDDFPLVTETGEVENAKVEYHIILNGISNGISTINLGQNLISGSSFKTSGTMKVSFTRPQKPATSILQNIENIIFLSEGIGMVKFDSKGVRQSSKTLIRYSVK